MSKQEYCIWLHVIDTPSVGVCPPLLNQVVSVFSVRWDWGDFFRPWRILSLLSFCFLHSSVQVRPKYLCLEYDIFQSPPCTLHPLFIPRTALKCAGWNTYIWNGSWMLPTCQIFCSARKGKPLLEMLKKKKKNSECSFSRACIFLQVLACSVCSGGSFFVKCSWLATANLLAKKRNAVLAIACWQMLAKPIRYRLLLGGFVYCICSAIFRKNFLFGTTIYLVSFTLLWIAKMVRLIIISYASRTSTSDKISKLWNLSYH